MSLPAYTPAADRGFFDNLRSAAAREMNKAKAKYWGVVGAVLETVDENVAQPALKTRNAVVETVADAGKSVVSGLKIGSILLVLIAGVIVFLYLKPFLPRAK